VSDHVRRREPIADVADTWITLAAIAVGSDGIRLGPMVTPVARRRPVRSAGRQRRSNGSAAGCAGVGRGVLRQAQASGPG
jgi:hypothetical protein